MSIYIYRIYTYLKHESGSADCLLNSKQHAVFWAFTMPSMIELLMKIVKFSLLAEVLLSQHPATGQ